MEVFRSSNCDAFLCATSHLNRLHKHSVRLRLCFFVFVRSVCVRCNWFLMCAGRNKKICQFWLRTVDGEYDGGEVSSAVRLSGRIPRAALRAAVRTERERAVFAERVPAETRRPCLQEKKHSILRDK